MKLAGLFRQPIYINNFTHTSYGEDKGVIGGILTKYAAITRVFGGALLKRSSQCSVFLHTKKSTTNLTSVMSLAIACM